MGFNINSDTNFVKRKVVLVVENDQDLREVLIERITLDGVYEVVAVENGYEAYDWLSKNPKPALVLTDFHMPCRGDILARSVDRLNIPVLMFTGNVDKAVVALIAMNLRIPVLAKSVCLNTILSLIDKLTATKTKKQIA